MHSNSTSTLTTLTTLSHHLNAHLDIDRYLNPFIPRNHLDLLPRPISHFLGYRPPPPPPSSSSSSASSNNPPPLGDIFVWFWAFLGAFVGLLCVEAIYRTSHFQAESAPIIVASLGASAILFYHVPNTPLSQPRNAIISQVLASVIGVGITKLFAHSPHFDSLRWVAGALSAGIVSAVMGMTNTVHPPAGATALLCATNPQITVLGWFFVPLVLLGTVVMIAVACVLMNVQRRYPVYWWTAADLQRTKPEASQDVESGQSEVGRERDVDDKESHSFRSSSETFPNPSEGEGSSHLSAEAESHRIVIDGSHVSLPTWLPVGAEEQRLLESLRVKLSQAQAQAKAQRAGSFSRSDREDRKL